LAVFRKPDLPELFTSTYSEPADIPKPIKTVLFLIHFYLAGFQCYSMTLHGAIILFYVAAVKSVTEKLR